MICNIVPIWLERLLGIQTESGQGTIWSIETAWPWPPWATLLGVLVAVAFVLVLYWRESASASRPYSWFLAAIRLSLVATAALMIAQTTLSLRRTGLPFAVVLLDDSLSMITADQYEDKQHTALQKRLDQAGMNNSELNRWNLARAMLTENNGALLAEIAKHYRLRFYYLTGPRAVTDQSVQGIAADVRTAVAKGEHTRLGGGIQAILEDLRGTTPAVVIVLTDGINTDGPTLADAAETCRRRGMPLYFVGLGSDKPVADLKLSDLLVDDVVFVDDVMTFECKLTATGYEGHTATVVLRRKDNPEVLAKTELTVGKDMELQTVRLLYRPTELGQYDFVVEVAPGEGERQTENNRQMRTVEVRRDKIRVLLVQAYPSYEYRYLRNMLQRDETIVLKTVLQEADMRQVEQDGAALRTFPLHREDLFQYDVVILGDADPALLGTAALQDLAEFVTRADKGSALVLIAGQRFMPRAFAETPLAALLPFHTAVAQLPSPSEVIRDGYVVQPTDLGLAAPSMQLGDTPEMTHKIWQELAPLYWLLELPELKPGVRVLAEHPTRMGPNGRPLPVFCMQFVGAGKVLFHATDETWRWRLRTGDAYFARYWVQTIRYLCRAKLADADRPATLSAERRQYAQGESVMLRTRFADERLAPASDDGVTVVVELLGRTSQRMTLRRAGARGVFEGQFIPPAPGDYRAWIVVPALKDQMPVAEFTVIPPAGEFAQVRMDAAQMRLAAKQTGGKFYTYESANRLSNSLPSGRQIPVESLPPRPLWNTWPALALFLGLLVLEWILRKRQGMV